MKSQRINIFIRYSIPSFLYIPEKVKLATKILLDYEEQKPPVLNISFLSAASIPLALPGTVARGFGWPGLYLGVEGVNSLVMPIFLEELRKCSLVKSDAGEKMTSNSDVSVSYHT